MQSTHASCSAVATVHRSLAWKLACAVTAFFCQSGMWSIESFFQLRSLQLSIEPEVQEICSLVLLKLKQHPWALSITSHKYWHQARLFSEQ